MAPRVIQFSQMSRTCLLLVLTLVSTFALADGAPFPPPFENLQAAFPGLAVLAKTSQSECPDIDGEYSLPGERAVYTPSDDKAAEKTSLGAFAPFRVHPRFSAAHEIVSGSTTDSINVRITQDSDLIVVAPERGGKQTIRLLFRKSAGEIDCRGGIGSILFAPVSRSGESGAGTSMQLIRFGRGSDGSLLYEQIAIGVYGRTKWSKLHGYFRYPKK